MKSYLLKIGCALAGISSLTLIYNFFSMYSLVGKCPESISVRPCQAYDNWVMLNKTGLVVLVIGVVVAIIGFMRQRRHNT